MTLEMIAQAAMQLSLFCERDYTEDGSISEEGPPQNLIKGKLTSGLRLPTFSRSTRKNPWWLFTSYII